MPKRSKAKDQELEVSFHKQNKQLSLQQNRLNVQILRVHTIEKQRLISELFQMQQQQLCQYFSFYQLFPYSDSYSIEDLLNSSHLKLIKNQDKIYFGEVNKKKREGMGINVLKDGKLYEGYFQSNEKNGAGIEIYPNGNLYKGQFQNNKKHGEGQFFWFNLSSKNPKQDEYVEYYEGDWWGGLPDGTGMHQKINGDFYTGQFKNGLKHGEGLQYFGNGDSYKGEYVNGLPEGYGEYSWSDKTYYKGDFKQGLRNGYGVWGYGGDSQESYKGHYCMDKKSGYGVYEWDNGWVYKGNFDNDLRNGFGELYDGNKLAYRGFWENGEQTDRQVKNTPSSSHRASQNRGSSAVMRSSHMYNNNQQSNSNNNLLNNPSSSKVYSRSGMMSANQGSRSRYQQNPEDNYRMRNQKSAKKGSPHRNKKQSHTDGAWFADFGHVQKHGDFLMSNSSRKISNRPQSFHSSTQKRSSNTLTDRKTSRPTQRGMQKTATGMSTIGSSISRPLMRNSNFGTLYVPCQSGGNGTSNRHSLRNF